MDSNIDLIVDQVKDEIDNLEPLINVFSGSYLIFLAIQKRNFPLGFAGSYLLYRGGVKMAKIPGESLLAKIFTKAKNVNVKATVIVNRPRAEVYAAWRKIENLPMFMDHLNKVTVIDDKISEWEVNLPGNIGTLSWVSEIVKDIPNERIGWQSQPGSFINSAGNVHFEDVEDNKTKVYAVISYHPPMGPISEGAAKLLSPVFEDIVSNDVHNFKDYIEKNIPPIV